MFGLLKKKISGFVDKLSGKKEEEKPAGPKEEKIAEKPVEKKEAPKEEPPEKKKVTEKPKEAPKKEETVGPKKEEKKAPPKKEEPRPEVKKAEPAPVKEKPLEPKEETEELEKPADVPKEELKEVEKPPEKKPEKKLEEKKEIPEPPEKPKEEKKKGLFERILGPKKEEKKPIVEEVPKEEEVEEPEPIIEEKKAEPEKPEKVEPPKEEKAKERDAELKKKVKKGLFAAVTETITGESEIKEEEVIELLDELELGMLESDVALSVAEEIKEELRKRILGAKVKRGQTAVFVRDSLRDILLNMFKETPGFEFSERMEGSEKPYKIMVVGPNGAGKTTTIAKIVTLLQKNGHSVCVAASDTFRAAAVEQLVHHGEKLGVKVIHGAYGADPASISFDAVNYARSNKIDIVLIDTAGRQETNINLLNQLKKMDRVIKPDLKIYVGESIAGNAMVEQISRFNADIGLDGVILTKLDCDAKGGTVISVSRVANLPILYVGVGQGYEDMKKFVAEEIVEEILS